MRPRVPEVHQKSVTQELGNVSLKTTNYRCADCAILIENRLKILGIETFREHCRIDEIAKHDRELPSLTLRPRSFRRILRNEATPGFFRGFNGPQSDTAMVAELGVYQ